MEAPVFIAKLIAVVLTFAGWGFASKEDWRKSAISWGAATLILWAILGI